MLIDVLPAEDGSWAVTRDRVVDGYFGDRDGAIEYALACAQRVGQAAAKLTIWPPLLQSDER